MKLTDRMLFQSPGKIPYVLTNDGTTFVYRSRNGSISLIDLETFKIQVLIEDKFMQKVEFISYCKTGILFYVWPETVQSATGPSQWTYNLEVYNSKLERQQCNAKLSFSNVRLKDMKEMVDQHSLLLYTKGEKLCVVAVDHLLQLKAKVELQIEDKTENPPVHVGMFLSLLDLEAADIDCQVVNKQIFAGDVCLIFVLVSHGGRCDLHYLTFFRGSLTCMNIIRSISAIHRQSLISHDFDSISIVDDNRSLTTVDIK